VSSPRKLKPAVVVAIASIVAVSYTGVSGVQAGSTVAQRTLPKLQEGAKVRVRLTKPCVSSIPGTGDQEQLLSTLGAVQQYIKPELGPSQGTRALDQDQANPSSQFGSSGMGWLDGTTVVFLEAVGDAATLQGHADALTALVPRPDRVVVCQTALSEARLREIVDTMWLTYGNGTEPRFYGATKAPDGRALIQLRADGEDLARTLQTKFDNDAIFTLGHLLWPSKQFVDGFRPRKCGEVPQNTGGKFSVYLRKPIRLKSGTATLFAGTVKNNGKVSVEFPRYEAYITKRGSRTIVASHAQDIAYTLESRAIARGQTTPTSVMVATDSCDPSVGYALPPGTYDVYFVDAFGTDAGGRSVSGPLTVRVTK
jgi:hypothetical protein